MKRELLALLVLGYAATPLRPYAAAQQRKELTVPWIMRGPELVGREPTDVRWSPDGKYIWFRWLPAGASWREPLAQYRVRAEAGGVPELDDPGPG